MRRPLLDSLGRDRIGTSFTANVPAPVGGWNTRDALADMDPLDATLLDNWFPRSGQCIQRGGSASWASGMGGAVQSLFRYTPLSGSEKLFAATGAGIYDITSTGAVGAAVMALTAGNIYGLMIVNSAGTSYWWGCNGADNVKLYDGATWSTISGAITGVSASNLIFPWLFKHRIFAIEKDSMNAWFLPLDSIQGAASKLPLGNLFRRGGYLVSGTSWTLDSGDGADDLCVFISSEGEVAVYKGIDPSSASSWALIGVYYIGKPLGRRCFFKIGGDVGVTVESGVYMLSKLLTTGGVNFAGALSSKIQSAFVNQVAVLGTTRAAWGGIVFPEWDAIMVNIPTLLTQYVMNSVTGAWCSFSGWDVRSWIVFNGALFFGNGSGSVIRAWDAAGTLIADSGSNITATAKQAYNYFGAKTKLKHVELLRPLFAYDGAVQTYTAISPDFTDVSFVSMVNQTTGLPGSAWDVATWDVSYWAIAAQRLKLWRAASHYPGYALALWLQTANNSGSLSWSGTDFIFSSGGAI